jgi:hypothetical protein
MSWQKNRLAVMRPNRGIAGHSILHSGFEHVEIRAIGIDRDEIPDFVWSRSEKDLFPVGCPTRVIRIVARHVFEDVQLSGGNVDDSDVTHVSCVACFLYGIEGDPSASGEIAGKIPSATFFSPVPSRFAM